jgi:hypothetical protein
MIKGGKGIHVKLDNEQHAIINGFFKKNRHLVMSEVVRQLLLNYVEKKTNKGEHL